jgi:iron complex outermembrane receptor protein
VPPPAKGAKTAPAKDGTFKMGEVTVPVTGNLEALETASTKIDAEQIQLFNRETVASALEMLPGVSLTLNSRNEQMLYVRGNDSRQVPVFVDGVPVYVPYDGEMDYGRFTTFDLSEIQVAKGFSSVLYGPNTLGGAINLVTRRPTRLFEGSALLGASEGNGFRSALNAGSRTDRFYQQASASYLSSDHWRLSGNFAPNAREDGGWRDNSYTRDRKFAYKAGWTPNASDEYVVGYVNQKGDKGNPVCAEPQISPTYWQWPTWNKESVYVTTRTAVGSRSDVFLRAYHDTYDNTINEFTDGTFSKVATNGKLKPTGMSIYKDFTQGALLGFETTLLPSHSLRAVLQTKNDIHRENNGLLPDSRNWLHYQDRYYSLGLEDGIALAPAWDLSLGAAWDQQRPVSSGAWPLPGAKTFFNGQAGAFWKAAKDVQVYATFAQKDHFPTLKDRYSLRLGTYIDNPALLPERSTNFETGVKASLLPWLRIEAALFRSDIHDLIQGIALTAGPSKGLMQMQNLGQVRHSGAELSLGAKPWETLEAGLTCTYLDRDNITAPAIKLTGTPRNRMTGFVKVQPWKSFHALASIQAQDGQWDNYSNLAKQSVTTRLGGFTTANLSLGWQPCAGVELTGGFTNLLDRNYQLTTGFPLPGRTWFANLRYSF